MQEFADLIAPMSLDEFSRGYYDQRWLYQSGDDARFADIMSWDRLNDLLNMRVWTARTFQLTLDRQRIPPHAYCQPGADRSHQQSDLPDPVQVMGWLERGASITLNEVESLVRPIRDIARILEQHFGAKSSANIYCSWKARQAFDSHFDRHDVFALHILGEKVWNIYRGRTEHPIEHALFHNVPQADYDRMKGPIAEKITMRPGDLLYLPRGQFHDALASSGASIHVTFSCAEPIGLDWLNLMWQQSVMDPEFRRYLPRQNADLAQHLTQLLERFKQAALAPETLNQIQQMRSQFGMSKPDYDLPRFKPHTKERS